MVGQDSKKEPKKESAGLSPAETKAGYSAMGELNHRGHEGWCGIGFQLCCKLPNCSAGLMKYVSKEEYFIQCCVLYMYNIDTIHIIDVC